MATVRCHDATSVPGGGRLSGRSDRLWRWKRRSSGGCGRGREWDEFGDGWAGSVMGGDGLGRGEAPQPVSVSPGYVVR